MDYVGLAAGLALPWLLGWSVLLAFGWPRANAIDRGGVAALRLGYGYFIGALLLTLWMRGVSAVGMHFGWLTIGAPLFVISASLLALARQLGCMSLPLALRRSGALRVRSWPRWEQVIWIGLAAWITLRLASLAVEIAWRPLYPWDAWMEWATKARVWYELGHIVPFIDADSWLARTSSAYFDASPGDPATLPLLQAWSCVALRRWDDSAMNWPWLLTLIAFGLSLYGALRDCGSARLAALFGAWLVVSLPLVDVQAALAGYPDLMLSGAYSLAVLALYRWSLQRHGSDACIAVAFALSCPLIKSAGALWVITLLPGIVAALLPERGVKLLGVLLAAGTLLLLVVGRWDAAILGRHLGLDFEPSWRSLVEGLFFFDNWHLLWYGAIALALLGARHLIRLPLAPLAMIAAADLVFLFVVFSYPVVAAWVGDATPVSRAALPFASLLVCLGVLLWNELGHPAPVRSGAESGVAPKIADA